MDEAGRREAQKREGGGGGEEKTRVRGRKGRVEGKA